MSEVHAIPTVYKGIEFRSRLEAKWAAMFDQLGWPWEYEPVDLMGYIPDFILKWDHGHTICEVKPSTTIDELHEAIPKIERSGWDGEAMIVGGCLHHDAYRSPCIGIITARSDVAEQAEASGDDAYDGWWWGPAQIHHCASCWNYSIHHLHAGWQCRLCGAHDGDRYLMSIGVDDFWAKATNIVKYQHGRR